MHRKIAIIGCGFAGLALGCFLKPSFQIFFYHDLPVEESASAIASGLLHPFIGYRYAQRGYEGMQATRALLDLAEESTGRSPITCRGIVRPITTEKQLHAFQRLAQEHQLPLWSKEEFEEHFPFLPSHRALFISEGLTIDSRLYLQGLKQLLLERGSTFLSERITNLDQLSGFDAIVVAAAIGCKAIQQTAELPIEPLRGQLIGMTCPHPLPYSLNSQSYIVMRGQEQCLVGTTFERPSSDPEQALQEMKRRAFTLYPQLAEQQPTLLLSQTRASPLDRGPPLIGRLHYEKTPAFFFTGLGSKGLLYHALLAEELGRVINC